MEHVRQACDVLLVGAGLSNGLIALEIARRRPELSITMVDAQGLDAARTHTWCLFESDVGAESWSRLELQHSWPGYAVSFPGLRRQLTTPYGCLTGEGLARRLAAIPGLRVVKGRVVDVDAGGAVLDGGARWEARQIVDGRGARASRHITLGHQKFVGLELELRRPHDLARPTVMDATVAQGGDYRFIYVVPTGERRVLVEDTRYADAPDLDVATLEAAVLRYARGQRWSLGEVVRREMGVLPVALDGDIAAYWSELPFSVARVGLGGAFFHPTTGYSLPDAVAVAGLVADHLDLPPEALAAAVRRRSIRLWRERGFYRLLNRMLFRAARPGERYRVLERFYSLPQSLIERFYAAQSTLSDKARILSGRPPVPIWRALKAAPPAWRSAHAGS